MERADDPQRHTRDKSYIGDKTYLLIMVLQSATHACRRRQREFTFCTRQYQSESTVLNS
jgi:hypothetical protein